MEKKYIIIVRYPDNHTLCGLYPAKSYIYDETKIIEGEENAKQEVIRYGVAMLKLHVPNLKGKNWFQRLKTPSLDDKLVKLNLIEDGLRAVAMCKDCSKIIIEAIHINPT